VLHEFKNVMQHSGEPFRRWFCDDTFDLILWHDDSMNVTGFQLCYRIDREEKAFTWQRGVGSSHKRVDTGEEGVGGPKMTPILVPDGVLDKAHVVDLFKERSKDIDPVIVTMVVDALESAPLEH